MSSSSSSAKAAPRPFAPDLEAKRTRLLDGVASEWEIIINEVAWLGEQLSASALSHKTQAEISLLQLFDVLHQQIRALSDLTMELARCAPDDDTEVWLGLIEAIPFSDIRERLIETFTESGDRPVDHAGPHGAIDWL